MERTKAESKRLLERSIRCQPDGVKIVSFRSILQSSFMSRPTVNQDNRRGTQLRRLRLSRSVSRLRLAGQRASSGHRLLAPIAPDFESKDDPTVIRQSITRAHRYSITSLETIRAHARLHFNQGELPFAGGSTESFPTTPQTYWKGLRPSSGLIYLLFNNQASIPIKS